MYSLTKKFFTERLGPKDILIDIVNDKQKPQEKEGYY